MAIILNIDTAVETASICLARESMPIKFAENRNQSDHAAWLHPALQKLATDAGIGIHEFDAIAISIGPGSYTGLRVGLAAAKGMCFALDIPLISVNTLKMMAYTTRNEAADLFCPLIDARRMEVFTAVYDRNFTQFIDPKAMIIDSNSFDSILSSNKGMVVRKLESWSTILMHYSATCKLMQAVWWSCQSNITGKRIFQISLM
jgi:tRNA threonylcarbamoyladenosine biosynthesis protein TsaB